MRAGKILGLLGIPFYLCSCPAVEKVKAFVHTEAMREYVAAQPLDVTLVAEKAGATMDRYVSNLKRFLTQFLGLEGLPITYSGKTVVETEIHPHLRVRARDFSFGDLPIREFEVHTPRVYLSISRLFSERHFRFVSRSRFPVWITLDAAGLATYIQKKQPQFQDFSLQLRGHRIRIHMTYPFLGVPMPIQIIGRMVVREGTQIHLIEPEVLVQGQRLADPAAEAIVNQFNPVFDGARDLRLPIGLELEDVETPDEVIMLHGHLVWESRLPAENTAP